jgi:hypothetical protein
VLYAKEDYAARAAHIEGRGCMDEGLLYYFEDLLVGNGGFFR